MSHSQKQKNYVALVGQDAQIFKVKQIVEHENNEPTMELFVNRMLQIQQTATALAKNPAMTHSIQLMPPGA